MKVLAIEDDPVAGMLMMATLRALGHEAELAAGYATAAEILARGGYRVVVSDWRMAGLDGLDFCRMLRSKGGDYVYFILVSTAKVTKATRAMARTAGVDDFLAKPVDPDELDMRLHVAARIIEISAQVKKLESFLPICGYCKKIRDDEKYWQDVESYFSKNQGTTFSHGVCPDCYTRVVAPQLEKLGLDPNEFHGERPDRS